MQKSRHIFIFTFWALVTLIPLAGVIISVFDPLQFSAIQSPVASMVAESPGKAAVLFVVIQVLQVVITPISHYAIGYLGGLAFGLTWGTVLNYVGRVIGHLLAFWLARRFGRPFIRRYIPDDVVQKYDRLAGGKPWALTLIYFLPLFPDDEISYLVGISNMRVRWFLPALLIGQVGGSLGLACLGAGINTHPGTFWSVAGLTLVGSIWLWRIARGQARSEKTPA